GAVGVGGDECVLRDPRGRCVDSAGPDVGMRARHTTLAGRGHALLVQEGAADPGSGPRTAFTLSARQAGLSLDGAWPRLPSSLHSYSPPSPGTADTSGTPPAASRRTHGRRSPPPRGPAAPPAADRWNGLGGPSARTPVTCEVRPGLRWRGRMPCHGRILPGRPRPRRSRRSGALPGPAVDVDRGLFLAVVVPEVHRPALRALRHAHRRAPRPAAAPHRGQRRAGRRRTGAGAAGGPDVRRAPPA